MSTNLKERAIIVNLTVSLWEGRKQDKTLSREVERQHQAEDAVVVVKKLVRSNTLEDIKKLSAQLRVYIRDNSLVWSDNGDRIISNEGYFKFITEVGAFKFKFNQLVEKFVQEYVSLKEEAKRNLKTMYREQDYPHEQEIRNKFDVKLSFMPIAEAEDLRIKMSEDMLNSMKTQITNELESRVEKAINSILERIKKTVNHMAETLSDPDKTFHDTLVGNIQEQMEMAPILNFTGDQHVKDVVAMLKPLIVNPETLRYDMEFRKDIAKKAKYVLKNI